MAINWSNLTDIDVSFLFMLGVHVPGVQSFCSLVLQSDISKHFVILGTSTLFTPVSEHQSVVANSLLGSGRERIQPDDRASARPAQVPLGTR